MAYSGHAWPVDSVVAIAALRQHDRLFPPRYEQVIRRWVEEAQARLDPQTGLLPHRVHPETGAMLEGARGSSQSMINRFLPEIDAAWGREHYLSFREQFVVIPLGVREYPVGTDGVGDVDSGPLLLGISASASVVSIGAARANLDAPLADALSGGAEAVGFPLEWGGQKRYGLGLLPVGDAMLAWSRATLPAPDGVSPAPKNTVPGGWRWPLHGLSLAALIVVWFPEWLRVVLFRREGRALAARG